MAATYDLIESIPLTGTTNTATFLSVPGTYTDLIIEGHVTCAATGGTDIYVRFNNDTGSNYYGTGAGSNQVPQFRAVQYSGTAAIIIGLNNSQTQTTNPMMFEVNLNNYASNSFTKNAVHNWSYLANTATSTGNVGFGAFQWRNTNTVTRVDVLSSSGVNLTGRISLYGILAGNA
jgi:hypothetical protein